MGSYFEVLTEKFGKDSLMALATIDKSGKPWVRTINSLFYEDSFYTITYALSNKIKHIENNPNVAISGEWFSGHAIAENLGYIKSEENKDIAEKLKLAFVSWYGNGHIDENDTNKVILKMKLTDGILYNEGNKYDF